VDVRRLLRWAPVKPEFGPTLPQLLGPRIDSLPRIARRIGAVLAVLIVGLVVVIALRSRDPVYRSHPGAPATFSTSYSRSMTLEPTPRGAVMLLEQHSSAGLEASFEITPLHLPSYRGEISGLLPVLAINLIHRLTASDPTFKLQSHGRTRINFVPGYTFTYQRTIRGMVYWGRYVLITPHLTGDRKGLLISMLTDPTPLKLVAVKPVTPDSVASAGVLFEPLERLRFG
jgi:hypothetical protein